MGRAAVRAMRASMSASYHILRAPEAPAPMAIASSAMMASTGWMLPGATTMPVNAENTTSDITRGFISCDEVADARLGWADAADLGFYARRLHLSPAAPRAGPCLIARLFSPLLAVSIATGGTEPPRPSPLSNLKPRTPLVVASRLDTRQRLVGVERGRRGQCPLERGRADAPRVGAGDLLAATNATTMPSRNTSVPSDGDVGADRGHTSSRTRRRRDSPT